MRYGPSRILTSSSIGGFFSCFRQPVTAKQRIRNSPSEASILRKCLKSGKLFQSKNSEKKSCRGSLYSEPARHP